MRSTLHGLPLTLSLLALTLAVACGGKDSDDDTSDTSSDATDTATEADTGEAADPCGDGACAAGEDCLLCPTDCACACGDGLCTFGEHCAVCPGDCDCETLAATPPMGWNSWNQFACDIDEDLVRQTAEAMVSSGMRDVGYEYVNLDDCWQVDRDVEGRIVVDPDRFPKGMKALADEIHAMGLKLGVYTCAGTMTCEERPGSFGYELIDAQTYADWGVDYVKVDWCYTDGMDARERYASMWDAFEAVDHPMVHSICNWGYQDPWIWGAGVGHLWRTSHDIKDIWPAVMVNLESTADKAAFAGPGRWNDPDMLEVGIEIIQGLTPDEQRAHMALWAIAAAPLIAGNDLRDMSEDTRALLTNAEIIAVNQDPLGLQAVRLRSEGEEGERQVWAKPLRARGLRAVVLFNRDREAHTMSVAWDDLGLAAGEAQVRDLFEGVDLGSATDRFEAEVHSHGAVFVTIQGQDDAPPVGETPLSMIPWMYAAGSLGAPERDRANGGAARHDGGPLLVGGVEYARGVGARAPSRLLVHLGGRCTSFTAVGALEDGAGAGASVRFVVAGDGQVLHTSDVVHAGGSPRPMSVDVTGRRVLELRLDHTGDDVEADLAVWADAKVVCE
jgi:alpha-galactosidase